MSHELAKVAVCIIQIFQMRCVSKDLVISGVVWFLQCYVIAGAVDTRFCVNIEESHCTVFPWLTFSVNIFYEFKLIAKLDILILCFFIVCQLTFIYSLAFLGRFIFHKYTLYDDPKFLSTNIAFQQLWGAHELTVYSFLNVTDWLWRNIAGTKPHQI